MRRTLMIRVDESLPIVIKNIQDKVVGDMKKTYNLDEIIIPATLASQILAAKHRGFRQLAFKIEKSGLNKGFLKLL
jgi:hypothetical protein